ncbi:MAG: hypothetical protein ACRDM7_21820, partial [Thermoleophilaceae bacterium]
MTELAPTVEDVQRTLHELRAYRSRMNREIRIDVELYNREFSLDIPEDFLEVKAPTTKSVPDRLADRLGSARVQNHIEPRRSGESELEHVEKLEKATGALLYLMRRRAHYSPIRAMALHGAVRGAFVPKFQVDLSGFSKPPLRESGETQTRYDARRKLWQFRQLERFPLMLDVRPIESIFPDSETDGERFVIEHYRRKVGDVKKNYPNWEGWAGFATRDQKGRFAGKRIYKDNDTCDYTEVWTPDWRGAMVDQDWLPIGDFEPGPIPNVFGRPPYWVRYAGYGDPAGEPHQKCVGLLRAIRDVALSESRLLTVINALAEQEAYGATIIGAQDEAAKATMSYGPGAVIETNADGAQIPLPQAYKPQNNLGGALNALTVMQSSTERGSVPSEAIGEASRSRTGTPSGVAAAILTGQASMIIDPLKSAIEDFLGDFLPFVVYVLDAVVEEELTLYGQVGQDSFVNLTLTQQDIDAHYGPIFVELKLRAPEDDYARWNLGVQALQAGFPPEFVMERFFGIENSTEMVKDMMTKQIAYSQAVRENYLI